MVNELNHYDSLLFLAEIQFFLNKIPVMTNSTLIETIGFENWKNLWKNQCYGIPTFITYINIHLKSFEGSTCCLYEKYI